MFEHRLKVFLFIICGAAVVVVVRSMVLQLVQADYWRQQAARTMRRSQLSDPQRGSILDYKGRILAADEPCIDAAVDYRAIERDPVWMRKLAAQRLRDRLDSGFEKANRKAAAAMVDEELGRLNKEIDGTWQTLAAVSGKTTQEMEQIKAEIRHRVEMRQRYVWYMRFEQALAAHRNRAPAPWYKEWIISGQAAPQIDSYNIAVAEQAAPHVILHNIDQETCNTLAKRQAELPGLVLIRSTFRVYPFGDAACHVLGYLGKAKREDLADDPNFDDELLKYEPNDPVGRAGIEQLCEQTLRGKRGRVERSAENDLELSKVEPVRGKDVRLTIDIELQKQIQKAFTHVEWHDPNTGELLEGPHEMHGAAVVVDVATGEVRALVSFPTYDLNKLDEIYQSLVTDDINQPLLNRATQSCREPGSTIKPIVGLSAITEGVFKVEDKIECTGFLVLDGHKYKDVGRCWVEFEFGRYLRERGMSPAHHPIPYEDPHPTGFLSVTDAVQRSCDPFFETLADKLKVKKLGEWYERFGFGHKTGLGIAESSGTTPNKKRVHPAQQRSAAWFAGIGQASILVTPIQMANAVATIARDGVWVRPRLLVDPSVARKPSTQPDVVDLQLDSRGLAAVKEGMLRAVNTVAGTGYRVRRDDVQVAGKTGTAQAAKFHYAKRDAAGNVVMEDGQPVREFPAVSTRRQPNNQMRWYRGSGSSGEDLAHGWFIGYAPAKSPQVAFAVMVEYGGSGGNDAAPLVRAVLDACVQHGYLSVQQKRAEPAEQH